jgi:hypothetical protein
MKLWTLTMKRVGPLDGGIGTSSASWWMGLEDG